MKNNKCSCIIEENGQIKYMCPFHKEFSSSYFVEGISIKTASTEEQLEELYLQRTESITKADKLLFNFKNPLLEIIFNDPKRLWINKEQLFKLKQQHLEIQHCLNNSNVELTKTETKIARLTEEIIYLEESFENQLSALSTQCGK